MNEALFSGLELEIDANSKPGYRLHKIEIFNWGTFDKHVWKFDLKGDTTLLTGDIGSGKSTLVDAVTTLLLPAGKIAYNKAAGAESKERNIRSYVQGHYRSERNELTGKSRPVGLRGTNTYTVILGVFKNEGTKEAVTLAQVFHQKDKSVTPERFYVVANEELSIEKSFTNFGDQMKQLRANLRSSGVTIADSFREYSRLMRRHLGMHSEQAMELFHQTVSMKSVGNLNDFVRGHMLEPIDPSSRIKTVVEHFTDLSKTYESVQTAMRQLEILEPLIENANKYEKAFFKSDTLTKQRAALDPVIAKTTTELIARLLQQQETELKEHQHHQAELEKLLEKLEAEKMRLLTERVSAGGDRLTQIEIEIPEREARLETQKQRRARFDLHLQTAGFTTVTNQKEFQNLIAKAPDKRIETEKYRDKNKAKQLENLGVKSELRSQEKELTEEITSLEQRQNALPRELVEIRKQLIDHLQIPESELPFAAELIEVADKHSQWRAAAERVLRSFGVTLLVQQKYAEQVNTWVNERHLGARLVYLRVPERLFKVSPHATGQALQLHEILEVEAGIFAEYVNNELVKRAQITLVKEVTELQNFDRAVTIKGLIKDRDRHEKDDRFKADDVRRWILGRNNKQKIVSLKNSLESTKNALQETEVLLNCIDNKIREAELKLAVFDRLEEYLDWEELDTVAAENKISELVKEHQRILSGSKKLADIDEKIAQIDVKAGETKTENKKITETVGAILSTQTALKSRQQREKEAADSVKELNVEIVSALEQKILETAPKTVEGCDLLKTSLYSKFTKNLDKVAAKMVTYNNNIVGKMNEMLRNWPVLQSEMQATISSLTEFKKFYEQVKGDDLPRFEKDFNRMLKDESIKELAEFNVWLARQAAEIKGRVATINEALGAIDYNPGRVIRLETENTINSEIKDFKTDLRNATGDLLAGGEEDAETRFHRVRKIIERFVGRENYSEIDKRWLALVTDVRNWYTFAAIECDRESGEVFEHYTDSDGKSGGQKEKLAYTILAASLSYQFKLEWGAQVSKDFRFVVIDEAFGRGSDDSTRYALELFKKLGLQLLIVTPLQKVHVIEPYVKSIGLVENPSGANSRIFTISIDEYRKRRGLIK